MNKHIPNCFICNKEGIRYELYDAYYCPKCGVWLSPICNDPNCLFCTNRPNIPPLSNEEKK